MKNEKKQMKYIQVKNIETVKIDENNKTNKINIDIYVENKYSEFINKI